MARIRTIKPEFWEDEKIATLSYPCRLFYIGTWNIADDLGVFRGNVAMLKSRIFPYDEDLRVGEVKKWLDALVKAQMVIPISYNNESYYIIRTFQSHQKIDKRYGRPLIEESALSQMLADITPCPHRVPIVPPSQEEEKKRKEKKEKEITPIPPFGDIESEKISFDDFWNLYDKKVGKKGKLQKKWEKLHDSERLAIMEYIPKYKVANPNKKYRKNPETFLNNDGWRDEILDADKTLTQTEDELRIELQDISDEDYIKLRWWMLKKTPYCSNPKNFRSHLSVNDFLELKKDYGGDGKRMGEVLRSIENNKARRVQYDDLYVTLCEFLRRR